MRNYDIQNFFLAVALVLIILFADGISVFLTDVIIGLLEFKWRL